MLQGISLPYGSLWSVPREHCFGTDMKVLQNLGSYSRAATSSAELETGHTLGRASQVQAAWLRACFLVVSCLGLSPRILDNLGPNGFLHFRYLDL